jgi:mRNA interferase RelE/StbE
VAYSVRLKPSAEKSLAKLPRDAQKRIAHAIIGLASHPFPPSCKKLTSEEAVYRIRMGDYRIIYQVDKKQLIILIVALGHRRDIYR